MSFVKEDAETEAKQVQPMYMRTTEELKAILDNFVGNFEKELEKHRKHKFLKNPPTVGMGFLRDRGLTLWYLENNWLFTNVKDKKRYWALTHKYIEDGIPEKESALEELASRRRYAGQKEAETVESLI